MGLDIYLYRYINRKETEEREQKYEDYSRKLWDEAGDYNSLSDEQKNEIHQKLKDYAKSLGLDEYGSDELTKFKVEQESKNYPGHYFKMGYFRSSYNGGGINRVLKNLGLGDLYDIFNKNHDEYVFQPNWKESLERVNNLIEEFKLKGAYRVEAISGNWFKENGIKSEEQALQVFLKESEAHKGSDYNYSNSNGHFYMSDPIKVLALIPGKQTILGERDCTYVITESDNSWYIQALEVVKETIEFVLESEDKEQYYLHWSG